MRSACSPAKGTDRKRSRFSEEHIIGVLKEHQAGPTAKELCRKHGISKATFHYWRPKYGGMEVSEAKWLRQLEDENAKLTRIFLNWSGKEQTLNRTNF